MLHRAKRVLNDLPVSKHNESLKDILIKILEKYTVSLKLFIIIKANSY